MTKIDLNQFCHSEDLRFKEPFSQGNYTYATDRAIIIRVPLIKGIQESDYPKNLEDFFKARETTSLFPLNIKLPPIEITECEVCEGSGINFEPVHDCPSCQCERDICDYCDGKKQINSDDGESMCIYKFPFKRHYIRLIKSLPGIKISKPKVMNSNEKSEKGIYFTFKGGDGLLMGMRWGA
jgi:hypothetical protein